MGTPSFASTISEFPRFFHFLPMSSTDYRSCFPLYPVLSDFAPYPFGSLPFLLFRLAF